MSHSLDVKCLDGCDRHRGIGVGTAMARIIGTRTVQPWWIDDDDTKRSCGERWRLGFDGCRCPSRLQLLVDTVNLVGSVHGLLERGELLRLGLCGFDDCGKFLERLAGHAYQRAKFVTYFGC